MATNKSAKMDVSANAADMTAPFTPCKRERDELSQFESMTSSQKKKAGKALYEAAQGETLPMHFLKAQQSEEKKKMAEAHTKQYEQLADAEANYIVGGMLACSKQAYVGRLGQLATRERARHARREEAELQRALDIQEGEALMRELECDEGAMSYWLHSHRRCRPPKCCGSIPPRCCPGNCGGQASSSS